MNNAITGVAVTIGALAPVFANAEVLTTQIGDTVTYVVTSPYWGAGPGLTPELTKEEMLERIRQSKPANLAVAPGASPKCEQPK